MNKRSKIFRYLSVAFFTLYFLGGVLVFRDYGVSFDELCQRFTGGVTAKYLVEVLYPSYLQAHPELNSITPLYEYEDRHYGVAFELPLAIGEKLFGFQEDTAGLYYFRHFATFMAFFMGLWFFWRIVRRRFDHEGWALAGVAMLALYPRFFAESFYNSKDIVFLATFIIGIWGMQRFLEKRTFWSAFWLALASAIATDVRVLGLLLPLTAAGFVTWELIAHRDPSRRPARELALTGFMVAAYCGLTILLWPFLWRSPIQNFAYVFTSMSAYDWKGAIQFMGAEVNAETLPWYYIPVWMGITLPLLHLFAFVLGLVALTANLIKSRFRLWSDAGQRLDLANFLLFLAPPLAAIVLHSVLYNGWRQMYFIAAPMTLVSLSGLHWLASRLASGWRRWLVPGAIAIQLAANLIAIIRLHPYQNVYFNVLAGSDSHKRFEVDYWGLSYREALEFVAADSGTDSVAVRTWSYTGVMAKAFLSPEDRHRIHLHVDDATLMGRLPDYQIIDAELKPEWSSGFKVVHEVKAGPKTINWIYKRTAPQVETTTPQAALPDSSSTQESQP